MFTVNTNFLSDSKNLFYKNLRWEHLWKKFQECLAHYKWSNSKDDC